MDRNSRTLSDIFDIKRGLATGSNSFFIVSRREARSLQIPERYLRPILPNPSHLRDHIVEADHNGHPKLAEKLVLIDCDVPEKRLKTRHPRFWQYLSEGRKNGVADRYLTSRHTPWYRQERREPPPFLIGYIGREGKRSCFRFVWNKSIATATNSYILLYPKDPLRKIMNEDISKYEMLFRSLRSISTSALKREARVYGGGLYKLEPGELGRVQVELPDRIQNPLGTPWDG